MLRHQSDKVFFKGEGPRVKYPSAEKFAAYFRKLPGWVILLIVILLFGRFALTLIFHLLS